nr:c-type cytochrome domain-containing protein [uncultured Dyadobacter sp.]
MLLLDSEWALFLGRFHPLVVHLPIGFFLIAVLFEVLDRTGRQVVDGAVVKIILLCSALGATLSCVLGYMLASPGGYDEVLLANHMWKGIALAGVTWLCWLLKTGAFRARIVFAPKLYLPLLAFALLLTMAAGHDGGSLTHGEEYLTQLTPEPIRSLAGIEAAGTSADTRQPIADIQKAVVYRDIVQPILQSNCTSCHGQGKRKGDLRMDGLDYLHKGGENGPALVSGKSVESELIKRCLLPEDDKLHMPPKGKPQLSPEQITLLAWWIDQGAPEGKRVEELKPTQQVGPALAALKGTGENTTAPAGPERVAALTIEVRPASDGALNALRKEGLVVSTIASNSHVIEVSAVNHSSFNDAQMTLLKPVAEQLITLKLGNTGITDRALKEMGVMKNLTRIYLENTAVTDAGIAALKNNTPHLEYVNLTGTKVTDAGLMELMANPNVKRIFVWQSAITENGITAARKKRPDAQIETGVNEQSVAAFVKLGQPGSR